MTGQLLTHHLLVPGLLEPPQALPDGVATPILDQILACGDHSSGNIVGFEQALCDHFQVRENDPELDLPVGALSLLGEGGEPGSYCWACVSPAHLYPDRDRLLLFPLPVSEIPDESIINIRDAFNVHFDDRGLKLFCYPDGRWYLRIGESRRMKTYPLTDVAGRSIDSFLPHGEDAAWLNSIVNEAQMLLHQLSGTIHGSPNFNTFWIWGFGKLPGNCVSDFEAVLGKHPLLNGLAIKSGVPVQDGGQSPAHSVLQVDTAVHQAVLFSDMDAWCSAIVALDQLCEKLLDQSLANRCDQLILQDDLGNIFRYRHKMRWRFWRQESLASFVRPGSEQSELGAVPF